MQKHTEQSKLFSLPLINKISPFFTQQATVPTPTPPADESFSGSELGSEAGDDPGDEEIERVNGKHGESFDIEGDRALTPPPAIKEQKQPDSPHRIPSFDFGDISLRTVEQPTFETARVIAPAELRPNVTGSEESSTSSQKITSSTVDTVAPPVTAPVAAAPAPRTTSTAPPLPVGDFGIIPPPKSSSNEHLSSTQNDSTTTRVRQRISREMIRETINQRIADGSISRRGSTQMLSTTSSDLAPSQPRRPVSIAVPPSSSSIDKALPREPGSPFKRPGMAPRSQTQSAHDVLKASEKDGVIGEPTSALDKIIALSSPTSPVGNTLLVGDRGKIPEIRARSPTPTKVASDSSKVSGSRSPSAASKSSTGSKKSRRSLSTSDVGDMLEPSRQIRRARSNPRLSLGINTEDISMLQAFNEQAANIGTDRGYKVKEKAGIKASYDKLGHGRTRSEAEAKAWRSLRRPSDMVSGV